MMGITVKTSHRDIGSTAEIYGSGSYNILSKYSEKDINIYYLRKKIFCALLREIILAVDSDNYVSVANGYAVQVVDSLGTCSRLLSFMDNFIMDGNFRGSICRDIASRRFDSVSDTIQINCTGGQESLYRLGNRMVLYKLKNHTKDNSEIKRLEMCIILNSLIPFMLEVYKIKINTRVKSVYGRLINEVFNDLGIKKYNGKIFKNDCKNGINYTRDIEQVFIGLMAVKMISIDLYKEIKADIVEYKDIGNVINEIHADIVALSTRAALHDMGLMSLSKYY